MNYYWIGGPTSSGAARYDWNTPSNWKTLFWNSQATGASFGWNYQTATNAPGGGDVVTIGLGGPAFLEPIKCIAPLLFGGYSGNASSGTWMNGMNTSGSVITLQVGLTNSQYYPFPYFGGGLTGDAYLWAIRNDGLTDSSISGATAQRATSNKLKVSGTISIQPRPSVSVQLNTVKSTIIPWGITGSAVITTLVTDGDGFVRVSGGYFNTIINNDTKLSLEGVTCGSFRTNSTPSYIDNASRFGSVTVDGVYKGAMWFGGSVDTQPVLTDLGFSGSATGTNTSVSDGTIKINPVAGWWSPANTIPSDPMNIEPTINIGPVGSTAPCYFRVLDVDSRAGGTGGTVSGKKWKIAFAAGASASTINLRNSSMVASSVIDSSVQVNIGTLNMQGDAVLDFSANNGRFDNWFFGAITGGSNPSIAGGIVFLDEAPVIKGSAGVRLFNTQLLFGGRFDSRSGVPKSGAPSQILDGFASEQI